VDPNAPPDTPVDTPPDTPVDTPPDTPVDTPPGTPPDTPVDTPPETPVDTPPDDPTGGTRRTPALQAVVTVQCGAVDGMFQAQFQVTNPTPYRFEGGLESLDPGASFSYGIGLPEPSGQFGVNGYFDVDADGSQGSGDMPYTATWPAVAPANCDTTTTEREPPGDLPMPPNPSLVVTVQTECVDDGASYLATFASSNPSPYTFYGLWVIPPGGTAYNVQGFVAPFTVTVTGYFDLDGSGSMTPPEFNTSQTVAVDPPADCDTTTTDPGTTEPGDTSEPAPPSDPTTTSTSTTTTTIPPCSEVAELVVAEVPPTVAPTAPSTAPPPQPPTVPPTDPTTTASTTSTTQAPRRTTTTTTAAGGPGPGLPIRTTTTLRIVVPPRITVPRPPGGMRSIDGGGVRASIGRPQPAVGACVDTSGTMLPATGSSMMPELVAVGSSLVLSGGALLAIRRRATP
ncbi:MAG TPA: LPXTG cell wall anchor domain-containing protein, partial [Desertimonas sp.]|nr:LPXTG cell wall anchor domain-containing protein [Desertimonas sp.]